MCYAQVLGALVCAFGGAAAASAVDFLCSVIKTGLDTGFREWQGSWKLSVALSEAFSVWVCSVPATDYKFYH